MTTIAQYAPELSDAPKLRLLPELHTVGDWPAYNMSRVLVAGGDANRRSTMIDDLARTLPRGTRFEQASTFWEVLVRAPETSMVILSGELDELPAESLLAMLAHRHPGLPVVSIEGSTSLEQARVGG